MKASFISVLSVFALIILTSCSHRDKGAGEKKSETYAECTSRHDQFRAARFMEIPEKFRVPFAGYHHVLKYYDSTPSIAQMKNDVAKLEKENNVFDARKDAASQGLDARLMDTSPGRNRMLISFERHRNYRFGKNADVTLFRVDYSKPEITYTCPLENFSDHNPSLICTTKGTITSAKTLDGNALSFKYDIKLRLVPINENYFYFEWLSSGDKFDSDLSADHYALRAMVYTKNDDRFFKVESPYLDPAGNLNPETCAELEGR